MQFIGGDRAEATLVPAAGFPLHRLAGRRHQPQQPPARAHRDRACRRGDPARAAHAAVGYVRPRCSGAAATSPVPWASPRSSLRIPLVLSEGDSHLGLANRMLARAARRVCLSFPIAGRDAPRYRVTGRPIPFSGGDRGAARERFGVPSQEDCVLVFGGSLGARSINEAALAAFAESPFHVLHVSGARDYAELSASPRRPGYDLREYLDLEDFAAALSAADLVVARAGSSVLEIAAHGLPAVLVPYPHATAGHQLQNARFMEAAGAARVIVDGELSPSRLARDVAMLLGDRARMEAMASAARRVAHPRGRRGGRRGAAGGGARMSTHESTARRAQSGGAPWRGRAIHFVGVGGAGMSAYARVAHELGARVSGSDRAGSPYLDRLQEDGVLVPLLGHAAENLPAGEGVELVYSSAVPAENPERAEARRRGLRERPRAELLAELTALRRTIAVAGSHGKTTSASMLVRVLLAAGMDPGWLVGGMIGEGLPNGRWGGGEWLVVEADESDRSMLELDVEIALLTNVELDHARCLRLARRAARRLPRAARACAAGGRVGPPGAARAARRARWSPMTRAISCSRPRGRDSRGGGRRCGSPCRAPTTRSTPRARSRPPASPAPRRSSRRAPSPTFTAPDAASSASAKDRAERWSTTTTRIIRARSPRRSRRRARRCRGARGSSPSSSRTCSRAPAPSRATSGARWRPPTWSWCSTSTRRASAPRTIPGVSGLTVAEAASEAARGRPVYWLPGFADAERALRGLLRGGDVCVVMGAGDVDELARRLVRDGRGALVSRERARAPELPAGVEREVPLARFSTVRTGGAAERFARVADTETLVRLLAWAAEQGLEVSVLGSGSNVLIADEGVPGLVLKLDRALAGVRREGSLLICGGAARLPAVATRAAREGLTGIEFGVNIPGTVGGAVRMNAGAYGGQLANVLEWVEIADAGGVRRVSPDAARARLPPLRARRRRGRRARLLRALRGAAGCDQGDDREHARSPARGAAVGDQDLRLHLQEPRSAGPPMGAAPGSCSPRRAATACRWEARASRPSTRTSSRTPAARAPRTWWR